MRSGYLNPLRLAITTQGEAMIFQQPVELPPVPAYQFLQRQGAGLLFQRQLCLHLGLSLPGLHCTPGAT